MPYPFFKDIEIIEDYGSKHLLVHWDGGHSQEAGMIDLEKFTQAQVDQLKKLLTDIQNRKSCNIIVETFYGPDLWIYDSVKDTLCLTQWDYARKYSNHKQLADSAMIERLKHFINTIQQTIDKLKK